MKDARRHLEATWFGRTAMGSATVDAFLMALSGHLTQYDQKQEAKGRGWNPYALSHYMGALDKVRTDTKKHHKRDDAEAMDALKASMARRFNDFPPVRAVVRKIDAWLEKGRMPKYPVTKRKGGRTAARRITLSPAYGRDYKSKGAVIQDFEADKDFIIQDFSSRWDGKPANKSSLQADYDEVNIRYQQNRKVVVVKLGRTAAGDPHDAARNLVDGWSREGAPLIEKALAKVNREFKDAQARTKAADKYGGGALAAPHELAAAHPSLHELHGLVMDMDELVEKTIKAAGAQVRTAAGAEPVIYEEDFDELDRDVKRKWKGYLTSMTYEVWDEEAVEAGDTDDKGWDYQDSHFDSLEEAVSSASYDASWLEWSSSSPGPRDWIVSQDDQDFRTGERTVNHLFVERADKVPLSKDEIRYITKELRL
jgi:hypothetical protein